MDGQRENMVLYREGREEYVAGEEDFSLARAAEAFWKDMMARGVMLRESLCFPGTTGP